MDDKERERIRALIDRYANWIIQDRAGDHDYLRMEIRRLEKILDEKCGFNTMTGPCVINGKHKDNRHISAWDIRD